MRKALLPEINSNGFNSKGLEGGHLGVLSIYVSNVAGERSVM